MQTTTSRRSRAEQGEQVRRDVLAAARSEFLDNGFHGTSLDRIAAAAGYTKGAVYSRFASKADLFLALLEERIDARKDENDRLARRQRGTAGVASLVQRWAAIQRDDLAWTLLVLEFRVHAARQPDVLARYAALHRRTVDGLAALLERVLGEDGATIDHHGLAQRMLALGSAATLEQAVDPTAFAPSAVAGIVGAMVAAAGAGT